ncbi:PVC-type heme-binding CxxCH protein [Thalassoglobus neptunius]|uniref:PVC-type heme-binding CxxCH protein n=1 Tax=Thalassoglobus neptunius TaxID=1938619 RepID=UPI001E3A3643|nr:PVC-type heme-binding CxxCH protein [Thalassoglobus neptunius]
MKLRIRLLGIVLIALSGLRSVQGQDFGQQVRETDPLTPDEERLQFAVPEGFEVQLFASEPDIQKPMNLAFDARGRLWMSGSNDYPFPNFTEEATDSIRVLEDTDGDGRADKFTTFVEGITIPIGLYPYKDGVIAFSIPNITFYRDTDGDGISDTSEVLYGPFDYSRDTHGLNNSFRRGMDGWMYACHGFNNQSSVAGKDGNTVSMQSGNTYRFRIDGSRIEHIGHGQVNPFGMAFDAWGDLYSSDCHTKPVTLLLKGGYYESFGKPHDGLGYVPPVMGHLHGSTAIAGLTIYTDDRYPEAYRDNLFVGNVMTSRIHRDTLEYDGSSPRVIEQEDFLVSADPWFRPVDMQCGPDGALYIADFYNRIIGHYEVPLNHPGRDRFRGRIWRVVRTDEAGDEERPQDLTKLTATQLIPLLADPNVPYVSRVVEQLVDRCGTEAVPELKAALKNSDDARQTVGLLWSLARLGGLSDQELAAESESESSLVRVHVQRILETRKNWSAGDQQIASRGLSDSDPMVRRASALAFAGHPDTNVIANLLQAYSQASSSDVQLKHAIKIALKSTCQLSGAYDVVAKLNPKDDEVELLASVSLAVHSTASARFLLSAIDQVELPGDELQTVVRMAARTLESQEIPQLVELARTRYSADLDTQLGLLQSMEEGLRQQGESIPDSMNTWGCEVIARVLHERGPGMGDWQQLANEGSAIGKWDMEWRTREDAQHSQLFMSSLPGGETARGVLMSKPFPIPEKLSFYVCGHLGFPTKEPVMNNYVSLTVEGDDEPVRIAYAPRNDTARRVEWDLEEFAGKTGILKVVDGIDLSAYAWIAIGEISPPVVQLPTQSLAQGRQRLIAASNLSERLGAKEFLKEFGLIAMNPNEAGQVRYAALTLIAGSQSEETPVGLLAVFAEPDVSTVLLNSIADALSTQDEEAQVAVLKTLPLRLQTTFARTLSRSPQGATKLADLIDSGMISPEVLRSDVVVAQVKGTGSSEIINRLDAIRSKLPDGGDSILAMIKARRNSFNAETASISEGAKVFEKNCAACHTIDGKGKQIGPQLDGIGNRGMERLLEDVLAPNRNIDVAFRTRLYVLENGRIYSGLFRREEGNVIVLANQKGEEIQFDKNLVDDEAISPISIMPENWGELIPAEDFNNLMAFLLSQKQK